MGHHLDVDLLWSSKEDPLGNLWTFHYDERNRLSQIELPEGTVDYEYDEASNLTRRLYSDGLDLDFTYDQNNRLTGAGGGVLFEYDPNGRIQRSNDFLVARDANGQMVSLTLEPGAVVSYTYNSRNHLESVTDWLGGGATFGYDEAGGYGVQAEGEQETGFEKLRPPGHEQENQEDTRRQQQLYHTVVSRPGRRPCPAFPLLLSPLRGTSGRC